MLGCQGSFCLQVVPKEKKKNDVYSLCLIKINEFTSLGELNMPTDVLKSLRSSQKVQKTTMQNSFLSYSLHT